MKIVSYIKSKPLLKILSLNSLAISAKLIAGFISIKIIAIFLNPSSMALLGNFKNFAAIAQKLASLGFQDGIVKYVADHKEDKKNLSILINTSLQVSIIVSTILGIIILLFSNSISIYIFDNNEYANVIKAFAILFPLYSIHILFLSILNGLKRFKEHVFTSILSSVTAVCLSFILIWQFQLTGALYSLAITESVIVIISYRYILKLKEFSISLNSNYFSPDFLKKFLTFSAMALFTALLGQYSNLFIRKYLISHIGANEAGYWETMLRISSYYLIFISSGLSLYYLPKLAELKDDWSYKKELISYYKTFVPLCMVILTLVFILKKWVVLILLNEDYLPVTNIFYYQLLGDFLKVCSLAFSYQFLAKKMVKPYFITELVFYIVYIPSSVYFINASGLEGVVFAYFLSYCVYFTLNIFIFRKVLLIKKP
ncbi:O-antigen translocase [Bacteroidota bacterium]